MSLPFWRPVPSDAAPETLDGECALFYSNVEPKRAIVGRFRLMAQKEHLEARFDFVVPVTLEFTWLPVADLDTKRPEVHPVVAAELGKHIAWLLRTGDYSSLVIPPLEFAWPRKRWRARLLRSLSAAFVMLAAFVIVGYLLTVPALVFTAPLLAVVAWALTWVVGNPRSPGNVLLAGDDEIDPDTLLDYAKRRALGERPSAERSDQRRAAIDARVESVREEYTQHLTDIVYRIENSALFDSAVPATASYQTALIRFDDAVAADVPLQQLDDIAAEVEIAYAVARDHAETVGIAHLPATARPSAERAAKAARLAARASTEGERVASLQQVVKILDSLALYYLPTIDAETLAIEPPRGAG